jgi:hypothetical protein
VFITIKLSTLTITKLSLQMAPDSSRYNTKPENTLILTINGSLIGTCLKVVDPEPGSCADKTAAFYARYSPAYLSYFHNAMSVYVFILLFNNLSVFLPVTSMNVRNRINTLGTWAEPLIHT